MRARLALLLLLAVAGFADDSKQLPYSEDAVPATTFDAQGTWTLTRVAAVSQYPSLSRYQRRRLLGTTLRIENGHAVFWSGKVMSWKQPFPTAVIGESTYDTRGREFWMDFQTDSKKLNLPRYVADFDVEIANLVKRLVDSSNANNGFA